jgi:hypothetical protein
VPEILEPAWEGRRLYVQRILRRSDRIDPVALAGAIDRAEGRGGVLGGNHSREEEWALLAQLWHFDYMGAAEFEFGALPNCLDIMKGFQLDQACDKIVTHEIELTFLPSRPKHLETASDAVLGRWARNHRFEPLTAPVYLICFRGHIPHLVDLLQHFQKINHELRCKEEPHIWESYMATESNDWAGRIQGWWEITQGWLVFKDKDLFLATTKALGLMKDGEPIRA